MHWFWYLSKKSILFNYQILVKISSFVNVCITSGNVQFSFLLLKVRFSNRFPLIFFTSDLKILVNIIFTLYTTIFWLYLLPYPLLHFSSFCSLLTCSLIPLRISFAPLFLTYFGGYIDNWALGFFFYDISIESYTVLPSYCFMFVKLLYTTSFII